MLSQITYNQASKNFEQIYDEVISTREPVVVSREGYESVSVIPTDELNRMIETIYLFQSQENAIRLLDALQRAKKRTNKPQTLDELRKNFGLIEEV
ncbi:type II toxin-antitoxin system Phd/YefM family antitoxin [Microcoleus sp. herbarium14]|uniref:type II toxin-antitoxin system Phd/YefM family antitoxin n=1 Tax=Microcoleus sp. herbarium14 TaxID=3055439 RepID=UPI002FD0F71E